MSKYIFTSQELRKRLTDQQFAVTQQGATEAPFSGKLLHNQENGAYVCIVCGASLFDSDTKYDSGTGWPSFYDVAHKENVTFYEDYSWMKIKRIEVKCAKCGSHLGHVFKDGPNPTGKRYCINSAALGFQKKP